MNNTFRLDSTDMICTNAILKSFESIVREIFPYNVTETIIVINKDGSIEMKNILDHTSYIRCISLYVDSQRYAEIRVYKGLDTYSVLDKDENEYLSYAWYIYQAMSALARWRDTNLYKL